MIICKNISKRFPNNCFSKKRHEGVKNISFQIKEGETFGIIGINGAGKSTLLKIILGFLKPSCGTVSVAGCSPGNLSKQMHIGYLPEHPSLFSNLSILEHLQFACRIGNLGGSKAKTRLEALLKLVGLNEVAHIPVKRFSKGMTQRAAIAYTLLLEPKILVLDEPMSGLDPLGRQLVIDILKNSQHTGTTILFCSHILADAERLCDRIAIMHDGEFRSIITAPFTIENCLDACTPKCGQTPLETLFFQTVQA